MRIERKTFVEFKIPDLHAVFWSLRRNIVKEIKKRNISKLKVPEKAYGFIFFDVLSVVIKDGKKEVKLESKRVNISPMHYYGGTLIEVGKIKNRFPKRACGIGSGYKKAIIRRDGSLEPFKVDDIFVKAE